MHTNKMIDHHNSSVPAFLGKLWKMVNDPKTDNIISWGEDGTSFVIRQEIDFICVMLPMYYKHNKISSFVRQLNMYGFRKIPIMDSKEKDKVEFEFMHQGFQRGHPERLITIKRKSSTTKFTGVNVNRLDETKDTDEIQPKIEKIKSDPADIDNLNKVLLEVKSLHSQYSQVDAVINNLKQENTVLWREIAILRQKQQKQLQIVNKLIQFLMTVVQPSTRRGGGGAAGLGVKRRFPLMIHATPEKKQRVFSDGPTIHELDSNDVLPEELLQEEDEADVAQVQSPGYSHTDQIPPQDYNIQNAEIFDPDILLKDPTKLEMTKSEHLVDELLGNEINENVGEPLNFSNDEENYGDVFLNSSTQDPLLGNLSDGCYNSDVLNDVRSSNFFLKQEPGTSKTIAKYPYSSVSQLNSLDDLRGHQDAMDSELDQLKDFLSNCNGIDSKYLLNLFNDTPTYGLSTNQNKDDLTDFNDLPSGSELTRYDPDTIDFSELKDDINEDEFVQPQYILSSPFNDNTLDDTLHTPIYDLPN